MRIALLSALADPSASAGERPALRRFAGKTVLAHQIDCAAHLACERLVCLATGAGPELAHVSAYADRSGLRLDVVRSLDQVMAQVTAADEVLLLADGVLPDRAALVAAFGQNNAVLAFPDDLAIAYGFERLDAARAWSGAARFRGDCVARLADLPPDCDMGSALLRIALQGGTRVTDLDPALIEEGHWQRRADRQSSQAAEWRWIHQQVQPASFTAPALAVAERAGIRWAHDAGGSRWALAPHATAMVAGIGAVGAWWLGWPVMGLALLALGLAGVAVADVFDRVEALGRPARDPSRTGSLVRIVGDAILVLLLGSLSLTVPSWLGAVLPLVLVLVLRIGALKGPARWRALFADRIALVAGLLPLAYAGWTLPAMTAILLGALGALLLFASARTAGEG